MKTFARQLIAPFVLLSIFVSCSKEIKPPDQDETGAASIRTGSTSKEGMIYIESNESGTNHILSYVQNPNGKLTYSTSTASGGNGSGTVLGSQGALQLSSDHRWLFAVNAGSNSISTFSINENGGLTLVATVSSNGVLPVSLTVHNNLLYVVNSGSANVSGFTIGTDGSLTLINGSGQSLSAANATPAQISFCPGGSYLMVTEKMTNKISKFSMSGSGCAGACSSIACTNMTPLAFDFSGNYAIVGQAAGGTNLSTVTSYSGGDTRTSVPVNANQIGACRIKTTNDGKYAYVSNAGSNTLSMFNINSSGMITIGEVVAAKTGMAPADLIFSNNGLFLYVINGMSHSISEFRKGSNTSLQSIDELTGLPAFAAGLVSL